VIRSVIFRRVVIVVAVLLVSGAAAAMKLTSWTPANMCFCPTPDRADSAAAAESGIEALEASGGLMLPSSAGATERHRSGALAAAPFTARGEESHRGKAEHEGGKTSSPSWGTRANRHSATGSSDTSSFSGSGPSASLGGLWKMMSITSRAPEGETKRVAVNSEPRAPKPPSSKPGPPAAVPTPPSGGISATPAETALLDSPAPEGSAFREDATPVAELTGSAGTAGSSAAGALGSGGSSALAAADASDMAATPEPASFALIATGLLGIAGLVRRRRI
jgi:PEP-CTERM motif